MSRHKAWEAIYEHWKAHHNVPKDRRTELVRGCIGKFAYPHFLAAMYAAISLTRDLGGKNGIYNCQICGRNHVGRSNSKPVFPKKLMCDPAPRPVSGPHF